MDALFLLTPIQEVPKVGLAYQKKLNKLGIKTVQDILFYFPSRYDDFSNIISISQASKKITETVCVKGKITEIKNTRTFKKWMNLTKATIQDKDAEIRAIWFNQPYITKTLKENDFVCLAGKVGLGKEGVYLNNPSHEKIYPTSNTKNLTPDLTHTGRIIPVYPETKGVTSKWLRFIVKSLLLRFANTVPETLPSEIIKKYKFLPVGEALQQIHFPNSFESADAAKERFSFEELFLIQLSVLKEKVKLRQFKAPVCKMNVKLMKKFAESLPFQLTDSQRKCSFQILKDLEKPSPMSRLLEGDVGSGKTVVATMAALSVVKNGFQVAFMAPTEILAKQHFREVSQLLSKFNVKTGLLTGKDSRVSLADNLLKIARQDLLKDLKNGQIDILIGTHSLIQKGITFKNLTLVIVDEQHRFGVNQRAQLFSGIKLIPHLLSMTATPIPRTLALTVYGDLDLSLITEMPKDRKKVKTFIVSPQKRKAAYDFIKKEVKEGKGIFVICPRIEILNSKLQITNLWGEVKAVKEEYEKLSKNIFPDLKIAMIHGKMKAQEKEKTMSGFKNGEVDILVSTSVVEVGIDVPRATVMMIEGAERFGLSQLHQFRGRVGRSDSQSYCFLFTTSPDQLNRKRLKALVGCNNGFELAQIDLQIRGPGQLYGSQQWGIPDMAMQGLSNIFLVEKTRTAAKEILEKDPQLKNCPLLEERLKQFKAKIHFE
ncbi:MAG: ATP-dependent DNA helicase RecG [Candidatus Staskawiczbacteria bacterium]|nr:ATP-dependent DNA helicase RecG [Candidatus Staskawiczbacteria bacterium]